MFKRSGSSYLNDGPLKTEENDRGKYWPQALPCGKEHIRYVLKRVLTLAQQQDERNAMQYLGKSFTYAECAFLVL